MAGVNGGRLLAGGLVAGLVINIGYAVGELLTAAEAERMLERFGLPGPGGGAMLTLALLGFLLGIVAVWLYAVLRSRYGAGPRTALLAGGVIWLLACLVPNLSVLTFGILSVTHFWLASAVDLVVVPAATVVGAWLYREGSGEQTRRSAVPATG